MASDDHRNIGGQPAQSDDVKGLKGIVRSFGSQDTFSNGNEIRYIDDVCKKGGRRRKEQRPRHIQVSSRRSSNRKEEQAQRPQDNSVSDVFDLALAWAWFHYP